MLKLLKKETGSRPTEQEHYRHRRHSRYWVRRGSRLAEGANVSICGRTCKVSMRRSRIYKHGSQVHGAICDIADAKQIKAYVAAASDVLGGIDGLVNNRSGFGNSDDEESWSRGIDIDVMGCALYLGSNRCAESQQGSCECVVYLRHWPFRGFRGLRDGKSCRDSNDSDTCKEYGA